MRRHCSLFFSFLLKRLFPVQHCLERIRDFGFWVFPICVLYLSYCHTRIQRWYTFLRRREDKRQRDIFGDPLTPQQRGEPKDLIVPATL